MPEVPQPVPISTTARAPMAAAMKRRAAPVAGLTGARAAHLRGAARGPRAAGSSSGRNSST